MTSALDKSLALFNKEINQFIKRSIDVDLVVFHRKIALDALSGIVQETPVLTGRLRGNWQTSVHTPIEDVLDTTDKNGGSTISKGAGIISTATPFSVIYITNNLPYAIFIEEGTSSKAPEGMVAITLERLSGVFAEG